MSENWHDNVAADHPENTAFCGTCRMHRAVTDEHAKTERGPGGREVEVFVRDLDCGHAKVRAR